MVTRVTSWTPPPTSVSSATTAAARSREPTGTGAAERTLFTSQVTAICTSSTRERLGRRRGPLEGCRQRDQRPLAAVPPAQHHPDRQPLLVPADRHADRRLPGGVADRGVRREVRQAFDRRRRVVVLAQAPDGPRR